MSDVIIPPPPSLDDPTNATDAPALAPPPALNAAPMTSNALANVVSRAEMPSEKARSIAPDLISRFGDEAFAKRNVQGDVPLDMKTGMPSWDYFKGSMERLKNNQVNYYQKLGYPVRLSDTGEIIVRVSDSKTGKPKDVLANPHGIELHDFLDLLTTAPEVGMGILAARKGGRGFFEAIKTLGKMAIGSEATGALKDIATREAQGNPVDLKEIFKSRSTMAATDVASGAVIGAAAKVATKAISPFSEKGPLQFDLEKARQYFQAKGFDLHSTPGEVTGNPFLLRMEAFARQNPGSSVPFDALSTQTANEMQKIQNVMLGLPTAATEADIAKLASPEQVGKEAMGAIGSKNLALEGEVAKAKSSLGKTVTGEIKQEFQSLAGPPAASRTEIGESIRNKVKSDYDAFKAKAEANYAKVEAHPLVGEKNIPADQISSEAKALMDKLPSKKVQITTDTGLKDQFGNPITRDETGKKIMWEFVPDKVKTFLTSLADTEDQSFRLDELLSMRREIRNSINVAQAIPNVQTKFLDEMESMVDRRIRGGLKDLDPQLLADWEKANSEYAAGMKKFKDHGIANVIKDPEQPGFIGSREIADRAVNDPDWLLAYKGYFGANSAQYKQVKRAILDDLAPLENLTRTVNGTQFFANLERMANNNKEVLNEVIGPNWDKIIRLGKISELTKAGKPLQIDAEELVSIVGSGTASEQKLSNLIAAESKRQVAYQNSIRKAVKAGTLNPDSIKPSEFVRYMAKNADPSEIKDVMGLISDRPELLEDIRRIAVQQVLNDASSSPRALDVIATHGRVSRELTSSGIEDALKIGDRTSQDRFKAILGQDTWDDLSSLRNFLRPRELKQSAFQTAGGLSAGTKIAQLERGGVLHFADTAIKNFLFATIYTSRPIRAWAANNALTGAEQAAAVNYIMASTPFVEALRRDFQDGAVNKAKNLKMALDAYVKENQGKPNQPSGQPSSIPKPPELN